MRYPPEHKAETIEKIVRQAGSLAKKNGFGTTGIDGLTKAAGLTTGAFYKHFSGKDELLTAIVDREFERSSNLFYPNGGSEAAPIRQVAKAYLSDAHLAYPEKGCLLPALSAEVARASDDTRTRFDEGLVKMHPMLAHSVKPEHGWAALGMLVGAVTLARASNNSQTQEAILESCFKALTMFEITD